MRCREARRLGFVEAEGNLPAVERRRLRAHLACCPECAERTRMEGWIERDLAGLRDLPAPPVEVSARVRLALGSLQPLPVERLPRRWIGLSTAAASVLAAFALLRIEGLLGLGFAGAAALVRLMGSLGWTLLRTLGALAEAVFDAGAYLAGELVAAAGAAGAGQAAGAAILAGWVAALCATAILVGRDLVGRRSAGARKEN